MKDWSGKRILVIGVARQGIALTRYLVAHGAKVTLNDSRPPSKLQETRERLADLPIGWVLGDHPLQLLEDTDLVCPSGGVPLELPLLREARERGIELSNDSQIFFELAPCLTIGITGSAGKSTTTTLVGRIAGAADRPYRQIWVGGNIGNPLISNVDEIQPEDLSVMELSSFQLDLMKQSPNIAALLNLTANHLDRHGTMAAYAAAKANILKFQTAADTAVIGRDDPGAWDLAAMVKGRLVTFGLMPPAPGPVMDVHIDGEEIVIRRGTETERVMPLNEIELRGRHNWMNVLAAIAITAAAGYGPEAMRDGIRGFHGLPHRLEYVRTWGGADWYNDSIATAPERAAAGVKAFDSPIVLLSGGRDKDLPWEDFARLITERVAHLVTFGESAVMIVSEVRSISSTHPETVSVCKTLAEAVAAAAEIAAPGDVVLFSPGGTSFDEFGDFAERGDYFKKWVFDLP